MTTLDLILDEVRHARSDVSAFVRRKAAETVAELGFGWRPAELAPSGLDELTAEFRACHVSGLPMRVYRHASDDTIYDSPTTIGRSASGTTLATSGSTLTSRRRPNWKSRPAIWHWPRKRAFLRAPSLTTCC